VKKLERELGEPLFLRLGRETRLTPAGRILLEYVDEALATLERARTRIGAMQELREGTLTIAASDTTACYLLPESLRRFRQRYPGVEVRVLNRPSPVAARLVAGADADLAVVTLPVDVPRVRTEVLAVREDAGICAPKHPLAARRRVGLEELARYPMLLLDAGSNTRVFIDDRLRALALQPAIAMELASIEVIKRLVQLDFGVSIVPRIAVAQEMRSGVLHAFSVFTRQDARRVGTAIPEKGVRTRAAQVYLEMLKASVR
jgi:DNA-binding transcriptional LysR family regulator